MAAIESITVLFDARCGLCRWLKGWLSTQVQLVPLAFVAADSAEARARFPLLDHKNTLQVMHVVDDQGGVYADEDAWIVVLWTLEGTRALSYRCANGVMRGMVKQAVLALAKYRPLDHDDGCEQGQCRVS